MAGSFTLLLPALLLMGAGNAANLQSRFAATDLAPAARRGRSLALVVWSTTAGAVAGPNLTRPGAALARALGIPELSGPFVFSAAAALAAAGVLTLALRPDPLLTAQALGTPSGPPGLPLPSRSAAPGALAAIRSSPRAASAVAAIVTSHAVMVAVMAMTPVHMHGDGASLTVIGLTISLHIAGMYALAPVAGWLADRAGRGPAILTGQALLITATLVTATAGHSSTHITTGLILLGLGWSFSTVAASTQLAESVPAADRPTVQGTCDLLMNLAAASAGAISGILVTSIGFTGLSLVAAAAVLPAAAAVVSVRKMSP
jgi:predicted MFS family arabinose efflux permease